jgi:hypothetical protein
MEGSSYAFSQGSVTTAEGEKVCNLWRINVDYVGGKVRVCSRTFEILDSIPEGCLIELRHEYKGQIVQLVLLNCTQVSPYEGQINFRADPDKEGNVMRFSFESLADDSPVGAVVPS